MELVRTGIPSYGWHSFDGQVTSPPAISPQGSRPDRKGKDGGIFPEEQSELEHYLELEHILFRSKHEPVSFQNLCSDLLARSCREAISTPH